MMIVRKSLLASVALLVGAAPLMGQQRYGAETPPGQNEVRQLPYAAEAVEPRNVLAASYPQTAAPALPGAVQPAAHTSPKIGAMPVASERTARAGAAPLPLEGKWQHVVTTFDPGVAPPDTRDFSPHAGVADDLWDDYKGVNDRWWAKLDYLRWRARGYDVPALVTQSPVGTPNNVAGRLPGAQILYGDESLAGDWRNGGRARLGWWAVDGQFVGYQAEYFGLGGESDNFATSSTSTGPILARPFFNTAIGANDASLLSGTGLILDLGQGPFSYDVNGSISVNTSSDIHSVALTRRHVLWTDFERNIRTDWLIGYRYFRLDEGINITDVVTLNNPSGGFIPPGTLVRRIDEFDATNDFHGGEVGLSGEIHRGRWSLEMLGKLGIGNTQQSVDIRGNTAVNPGGSVGFTESPGLGGFLAQPGLNIGGRERNAFTLMPEAELAVNCQLTNYLRLQLGVNVVYVNHVVRPGNQIDTNVNPTFFPPAANPIGAAGPEAQFNQTYLLMYGFNAGLEATW